MNDVQFFACRSASKCCLTKNVGDGMRFGKKDDGDTRDVTNRIDLLYYGVSRQSLEIANSFGLSRTQAFLSSLR